MFIGCCFPVDGTPRAAYSGGAYKFRHETAEEAKASVESFAKSNPTFTFTGFVLDEDAMKVVMWTKYAPRPIVEWHDPEASELERILLGKPREIEP